MRGRALVIALLAGALGAAPAAAGAAQAPAIVPAGKTTFPERAYVLTLPRGAEVAPSAIGVTENGERPSRLSILSGDEETAEGFGVVLVIDASESMRGRSIREAVAAARGLAARRSVGQKLGIVTFNDRADVLLAPTTNVEAIDSALSAQPRLAPQTHLQDAVNTALDQLESAGVTAGSIVALSDGADTGSALGVGAVGRRARRSNVRIFSIGLRSGAFNPSELRALAAAGRGRYTEAASASRLVPIFEQIGSELAGEHLIRYRSEASRGTDVRVAVRVDGIRGVAGHLYRAPGLLWDAAEPRSFWSSSLGLLVVSMGSALLIGLALGTLLLRLSGRGSVRDRIAAFVRPEEPVEEASSAALLARQLLGGTERSLEQTRWWEGFREDVELARIELPAVRVVYCTVAATLIVGSVLTVAIGPVGIAFALGVPLALRAVIRARIARQRRAFADQLPDTLQGVASAMRAGHGLVAALAVTVDAAPEPSRTELRRVVADERLGIPLEEALSVVQRRMGSRDVQQIALVAEIQRETGGNMAEVLDRVTEAVRDRMDLRRMVRALTAQGRMSRWVLTALPILLLAYIAVVDYDYAKPLLETGIGRILLLCAGVMLVAGSEAIRRIVEFEV